MRKFAAMNKLKKAALLVIARSMNQEQIQGLKELFHRIDADGSGTITVEELRDALTEMGNQVTVYQPAPTTLHLLGGMQRQAVSLCLQSVFDLDLLRRKI